MLPDFPYLQWKKTSPMIEPPGVFFREVFWLRVVVEALTRFFANCNAASDEGRGF